MSEEGRETHLSRLDVQIKEAITSWATKTMNGENRIDLEQIAVNMKEQEIRSGMLAVLGAIKTVDIVNCDPRNGLDLRRSWK